MSFQPLIPYKTVTLTADQLREHGIDNGSSPEPSYGNSIFAVVSVASGTCSELGVPYSEQRWYVTRVPRSAVQLPLNTPMTLTLDQVSALRINMDTRRSDRPELSGYKFDVISQYGGKYLVTKRSEP
jgi:hypothetical protein